MISLHGLRNEAMKGIRIYLSQDLCLRKRNPGGDPWYRVGETMLLSAGDIARDRSNGMSDEQRKRFGRRGSHRFLVRSEGLGWFRVVDEIFS